MALNDTFFLVKISLFQEEGGCTFMTTDERDMMSETLEKVYAAINHLEDGDVELAKTEMSEVKKSLKKFLGR